ncbi:MAG: large conductance mechanosensitive channel protein MscL [bacterium]|nr:large conductance mechanosensitive channel protein MscL [bacterium]
MIKKHVEGFREFIIENGVVGLAIGFVLAGAVTKLVAALVTDMINPFVGLILGQTKGIEKLTFHVGSATILLGSFISAIIDFTIVALVVYFGYKWLKLEKLKKQDEEKKKK